MSLLILAGCKGFFSKRDDSGGGGGGGTGNPAGKFLYVANSTTIAGSSVSGYTINGNTGGLALIAQSPLFFDIQSVAVDPTGSRVFALLGSNGILTFQVDRNTGALAPEQAGEIPLGITGEEPSAAVVSADGKYLFMLSVPDNKLLVCQVGTLGALSNCTSYALLSGGSPVGLTLGAAGRLLYVADDTGTAIFTVNTSNGSLDPQTPTTAPTGSTAREVAITPDGKFAYVSSDSGSGGINVYAVNASNGTLTSLSESPVSAGSKPGALVVEPTGKYLYVANTGSGNVSEFAIGADGSLLPISGSPVSAGNNPVSIAADPSGLFMYVANKDDGTVSIYKIGSNGALNSGGFIPTANPNSIVVSK